MMFVLYQDNHFLQMYSASLLLILNKQSQIMLQIKTIISLTMCCLLIGLTACADNEAPVEKETKSELTEAVKSVTVVEPVETVAAEPEMDAVVETINEEVSEVVVAATSIVEETVIDAVEQAKAEIAEVPEPRQLTVLAGATSFSPKVLFANPGDEICWVNMTAHDSQSIEGLIPEGAEPWHIALGRNGCVTLTVEGVYIYKCNPHYPVGMAGAIVVGKANNIEQIEANATGRAKGVVIKVKRALEQ